jgi:hypothetical protein
MIGLLLKRLKKMLKKHPIFFRSYLTRKDEERKKKLKKSTWEKGEDGRKKKLCQPLEDTDK